MPSGKDYFGWTRVAPEPEPSSGCPAFNFMGGEPMDGGEMKHDNILPINAFYLTWLRDKGNRDIDSLDLLIYIMLLSRAGKETLTCYPSIDRIMEDCRGLSRVTVLKHLDQLEAKRLIKIKKRPGKPSEYFMLDFAEWRKDPHY